MLATIQVILGVAQSVFGLRTQLSAAKKERKAEVADFIESIASLLEETAASLRQGQYPHGRCEQLRVYAQQMGMAIGDLIGAGQASDLGHKLESVWQIEQLFGQLGGLTPAERDQNLAGLEQAAGLFHGTAAVVRVSR